MLGFSSAVGLEIAHDEIRIAQLYKTPFSLKVVKYETINLDCFASVGVIHKLPVLKILSLPRKHVFLKIIQMPALRNKELKQALNYAIEEHIPYQLDEVIYDYQLLGVKEGKRDILLGAVRKDVLKSYLDILSKAGIEPNIIEVDSVAIVNLCLCRLRGEEIKQGNVLISNRASEETILLKNGQFQFSRLGEQSTVYSQQPIDKIIDELQSIDYGIKTTDKLPKSSFASVALAFSGIKKKIGINLSPLKEVYAKKEKEMALKQTILLCILILFLGFTIVGLDIVKKKHQITIIGKRLALIQPEIAKILAQRKELNQLNKQLNILEVEESINVLGILNELANILPKDVWIKSIVIEKDEFRLQVKSLKSTTNLLPILEASPYFEKVEFKGNIVKVEEQGGIGIEECTLIGNITG